MDNNISLDMNLSVDLKDVEDFIYSDNFANYLINNAPNFETAGFIFQSLIDMVEEIKNKEIEYNG